MLNPLLKDFIRLYYLIGSKPRVSLYNKPNLTIGLKISDKQYYCLGPIYSKKIIPLWRPYNLLSQYKNNLTYYNRCIEIEEF